MPTFPIWPIYRHSGDGRSLDEPGRGVVIRRIAVDGWDDVQPSEV